MLLEFGGFLEHYFQYEKDNITSRDQESLSRRDLGGLYRSRAQRGAQLVLEVPSV